MVLQRLLQGPRGRAQVFRETIEKLGLRQTLGGELKLQKELQQIVQGQGWSGKVGEQISRLPFKADPAQRQVAYALDKLLSEELFTLWPLKKASGTYIHGSVGTGKTMLLDCAASVLLAQQVPHLRIHFNDFMIMIHQRIRGSTLQQVSNDLVKQYKFICFDEFQVTDVADAVLLHELFITLFQRGTTVIFTSNRSPEKLYENGLNRKALFEPFQHLLRAETIVLNIDTLHADGTVPEYRCEALRKSGLEAPVLFSTEDQVAELETLYAQLTKHKEAEKKVIPVAFGRQFEIQKYSNRVARFQFSQLCAQSLGAVDFIALANYCDVILIENVPLLEDKLDGITRRFITLVDVMYDRRVKLLLTSPHSLDSIFTKVVEPVSTMDEEFDSVGEIHVSDEGGPSGRLTTMISGDVAWSATGRMGASLARGDDVAFAVHRARSRLLEMQTKSYWSSK